MHFFLTRADPSRDAPLPLSWAVVLFALVSFLQVQSLRPDWHAAIHAAEGTHSTCAHHDHSGHPEHPEEPATPLGHTCEFTAVATGMLVWSLPVLVPEFVPVDAGTLAPQAERATARHEISARARAPPQDA